MEAKYGSQVRYFPSIFRLVLSHASKSQRHARLTPQEVEPGELIKSEEKDRSEMQVSDSSFCFYIDIDNFQQIPETMKDSSIDIDLEVRHRFLTAT